MKRSGKIAMILAGVILLLHSFLPHHHHNEISEAEHVEVHEEARTVIDYILLAFHNNPGENHLEEFKNAQQYQLQLLLVASVPNFDFGSSVVLETLEKPSAYSYYFPQPIHYQNLQFRGPPA